MRGCIRFILFAAISAIIAMAAPAYAFNPPVEAPVAEPFDMSSGRYGPGNRGLDYRTAPHTDVAASDSGEVTFAGEVAGQLWVTITHAGGIRTSYGPLTDVSVSEGDFLAGGQIVGITAGQLHFSARVGEDYIDPATLFGHVRLLPIQGPTDVE